MSFTLGPNDLVSGVTFFFFSCISVRESSSPKTASEAKQRAPPGKTREVGEVGEVGKTSYKWGFFSLDRNGVFVLFPNILYASSWKREEEVHNPTSTSYSFPTFSMHLVGGGRKRYTTLRALRKARKFFGLERHLCTIFPTFPMYLVWERWGKRYKHGIVQNGDLSIVGKSPKTTGTY